MESNTREEGHDIAIRPSPIFAFLKIVPPVSCSLGVLYIAWQYYTSAIWLSMILLFFGVYRYLFIRRTLYVITSDVLRFQCGIFFKRTDTVELFRVKDYIITQSFLLQIFGLMDLTLKTTDPESPVVWLRGIPLSDLTEVLRERIINAGKHNRIYEIT